MTLSSDGSVSWRLNDLLAADRKAKAYADVGWNDADSKSPAALAQSFKQWSPILVEETSGDADEQDIDETLESIESGVTSEEAEPQELVSEQSEEGNEEAESQSTVDAELEAEKYAEEALQAAKKEAHDAGYEKGHEEARAHFQKSKDSFEAMVASLRAAQNDMNEFYQPLKKLALHLAQQLVRGELSLSSSAIERLIKAALDDIEAQGEGPIIIFMHPSDSDHFGEALYDEYSGIELRSDRTLSQGSVRVSIDDSAIEDLMEHRLSRLAQQVLGFSADVTASVETGSEFINQVEEKIIEGSSLSTDKSEIIAAPKADGGSDLEGGMVTEEQDQEEPDSETFDMEPADSDDSIQEQPAIETNQNA